MQDRPPFELIRPGRARIGASELRAHYDENASPNGDKYVIEATADQYQPHGQYLLPHELRVVKPTDLPNGAYISIERLDRARTGFKAIHFLTVRKRNDELTLALTATLDHADWHLPTNLITFAESYVVSLGECENGLLNISLERGDYGVSVTCALVVPPAVDLYSSFKNVAEILLRRYRECIAADFNGVSNRKKSPTESMANDSSGAKWWVRYVVVPVLGSGAFAAIVLGLIALAK